jgi:hypothetical protein
MTKRVAIPSENQEQRWLVKWLSSHPQIKDFFCKNNNEGKRTEVQTWNLKLMGLRPGVSDLFIPYPSQSGKYAGLWLEVKRNMNYPPSARKSITWIQQEVWIERMKSVGFDGRFCYGWVNGKEIIEGYLLS